MTRFRLHWASFLLVAAVLSTGLLVGCGGPSDESADAPSATTAVETVDGVGEPDWVKEAVVYEVFVPDFSEEGTFRGVIDRLDELEAMGVNTLWLMPIHPVGEKRAKTDIGALGSPYAVRDYKGVNPAYGGEEQFRALVDSVHARDMKIIIDWVANHTAWDHPWIEEHPEYYTEGPIDGRFTVPLMDGDTTDWTDVVDLNYDNEEMRAEMIDAMQYWVREYNIDGYRCDVAHEVPLDFWETAIDSVEAVKPVLMLAEAGETEMHEVGFDQSYAWAYYGTLKRVWEEGDSVSHLATQVDTTLDDLVPQARRLRFTTNHDESMWDATPPELFFLRRAAVQLGAGRDAHSLVHPRLEHLSRQSGAARRRLRDSDARREGRARLHALRRRPGAPDCREHAQCRHDGIASRRVPKRRHGRRADRRDRGDRPAGSGSVRLSGASRGGMNGRVRPPGAP